MLFALATLLLDIGLSPYRMSDTTPSPPMLHRRISPIQVVPPEVSGIAMLASVVHGAGLGRHIAVLWWVAARQRG